MGKIILQQDDCAPDSYEFFQKDFLKATGMRLQEFKDSAIRTESDSGDEHWYKGEKYTLSICASDPYWIVYEN